MSKYYIIIPALIEKLYRKAIAKVRKDARFSLSNSEVNVLRDALKTPAVIEAIESDAITPNIEAERLCEAIQRLPDRSPRMADKNWVNEVVWQLLYQEHVIEGKYD